MKKAIIQIVTLIFTITILISCAGESVSINTKQKTLVNLSGQNFRIKKLNVTGESYGFAIGGPMTYRLVGLMMPVSGLKISEAYANFYKKAGVKEGDSSALINLSENIIGLDLIAFSFPAINVRADVIEFVKK